MNNTWQLCPKCNGNGVITTVTTEVVNTCAECDVCNGKKIISQLTGLPPYLDAPLPPRKTEDRAWSSIGCDYK